MGCCVVLAALGPVRASEVYSEETAFAAVRVDLQAGTFLDPLPFDRPFLLVGQMPASIRAVEVRIGEFLEEPVTPSERQLERFETQLRARLEAAAAGDSLGAPASSIDFQSLRQSCTSKILRFLSTI